MFKIETGKAKASFSEIKKRAQTQDIAITRHGKVEAYMISPDRYSSFVSISEVGPDPLRKLEDEFKALVAGMQTPSHRRAMRGLRTLPLREILRVGAAGPAGSQRAPQRAAKVTKARRA